ncbi:hypothetical protein [Aquimarina algiphila]|uniref:ORC-CDC6 family AAA ATPase n=1 Tax=Aquimarina algiphila TaxID=2047982 RepID=UPI002491CEFB|nr:hypothetical protein [Aquimarina algiphila]
MVRQHRNPFEFEAANNLSDEEILDYYIDDYNYSRFINTTRNIFLEGARGTGKTMSLLYNSFRIQYKKAIKENKEVDYSRIGIYIPCNTPLFHKKEHLLLKDDFKASLITEHFLVLSIVNSISNTLSEIKELDNINSELSDDLKNQIEYLLGAELMKGVSFFRAMSIFSDKESTEAQKIINNQKNDEFYQNTLTFSSLVMPFLKCIKQIGYLKESHFLLLIDDAHDLNIDQKKTINSWIAYRDHSQFSFKVATAETSPNFITSTGGMILEGHDFVSVDMLKPYQNKESEFGKLAKKIILKRLQKYGINQSVSDFFPISPSFKNDIDKAREKVRKDAMKKYDGGSGSQISDHIAKYTRAEYFKSRPSKANLPPYSGFETIIDVSTGVIRNLLDPCYWMYDAELSEGDDKVELIPHKTQQSVLISRSNKLWERLEGLDKTDVDCSKDQAEQIFNLFENLMVHFKRRLMSELSEPRTVTFVITSQDKVVMEKITPLLDIAQKAQLLYTRLGKDKRTSKKVTVYVPNRLLLISRGLDPHGQYASASIKSKDIMAAAINNKKIPIPKTSSTDETTQIRLFDSNGEKRI